MRALSCYMWNLVLSHSRIEPWRGTLQWERGIVATGPPRRQSCSCLQVHLPHAPVLPEDSLHGPSKPRFPRPEDAASPSCIPAYLLPPLAVSEEPMCWKHSRCPWDVGGTASLRRTSLGRTRPLVPQYFTSFLSCLPPRKSSRKKLARTAALLSFLSKCTTPRAP